MRGRWAIEGELKVQGTPRLQDVEEIGATAIVTVCTKLPPPEVIDAVLEFHHIPIPDGQTVMEDDFWYAADTVLALLARGHVVILNCLAGRTRSWTVAALVAMELGTVHDGADAIRWARERRPLAIANAGFEAWLRRL